MRGACRFDDLRTFGAALHPRGTGLVLTGADPEWAFMDDAPLTVLELSEAGEERSRWPLADSSSFREHAMATAQEPRGLYCCYHRGEAKMPTLEAHRWTGDRLERLFLAPLQDLPALAQDAGGRRLVALYCAATGLGFEELGERPPVLPGAEPRQPSSSPWSGNG